VSGGEQKGAKMTSEEYSRRCQVVIDPRERAELNLVGMQLARLVRYKERAEGKGGTDALA
jgi:hypothetical protein